MACARCSWRLWILVEALAQVWVLLVGWPQAFMHSPPPTHTLGDPCLSDSQHAV